MIQATPSRFLDKYVLRMPDGMRAGLKEMAARNHRSLNAEMVFHLERALRGEQAAGNGPEKANPAAIEPATARTVTNSTNRL